MSTLPMIIYQECHYADILCKYHYSSLPYCLNIDKGIGKNTVMVDFVAQSYHLP